MLGAGSLSFEMIPVPVLTPWLSSLWLGMVTPMQAVIGRKLIESIRNPTVVEEHSAARFFDIKPCNAATAIARALKEQECGLGKGPAGVQTESLRLAG